MPAGSSLDFWIATEGWLPQGDPIAAAVPRLPAGLALVTGSILGPLVGLQLACASPAIGTDYEVGVTITTAAGVVAEVSVWLHVDAAEPSDAQAPAAPSVPAISSSGRTSAGASSGTPS